jgi:hypothetical protein
VTADRLPPGLTNSGLFDPADLGRVDPEWTLDGEPGWPHLRGFGLLERLGYFLEPATTDDRLTFILRGGDPPTNLAVGFVTNESIPLDEPTTASGSMTPATFLFDPEQSGILLLRDSPGVLCAGRRLRLLPRTNPQTGGPVDPDEIYLDLDLDLLPDDSTGYFPHLFGPDALAADGFVGRRLGDDQ